MGFLPVLTMGSRNRSPEFCRKGAWQGGGAQLIGPLASTGAKCPQAHPTMRRGGREVECAALEMRYTGNRIVGSNPTLSAIGSQPSLSLNADLDDSGGCFHRSAVSRAHTTDSMDDFTRPWWRRHRLEAWLARHSGYSSAAPAIG